MARERWAAVAPTLAARGHVDVATLTTYCQVWARWREAEDKIAQTSQLVKTPRGGVTASPLIAISNQAASQVRQLERALGIDSRHDASEAADEEPLLTRDQLAKATGHHRDTITRWMRDPTFPVVIRGSRGRASLFRLSDVLAWDRAQLLGSAGPGTGLTLQAERAALARAQRLESEQRLAIRARTLVEAGEVERVWSAEQAAIKARLLALPLAYADRMDRAVETDGSIGAERTIQQMVDETLREFARGGKAARLTRPTRATSAKRKTRR